MSIRQPPGEGRGVVNSPQPTWHEGVTYPAASVFRKRWFLAPVALLWFFAIGFGSRVLFQYSFTPGAVSPAPKAWPAASAIQPQADKARLLIFAHPQCPCSRATIHELAGIMDRYRSKVDAYVIFLAPAEKPAAWVKAGLWRAASDIPGVHAVADAGGREARRFGALTSGQSLLYDSAGRLLFSGGLTAARGQEGPSNGSDALGAFLQSGLLPSKIAPVFGCSLNNAPAARPNLP